MKEKVKVFWTSVFGGNWWLALSRTDSHKLGEHWILPHLGYPLCIAINFFQHQFRCIVHILLVFCQRRNLARAGYRLNMYSKYLKVGWNPYNALTFEIEKSESFPVFCFHLSWCKPKPQLSETHIAKTVT